MSSRRTKSRPAKRAKKSTTPRRKGTPRPSRQSAGTLARPLRAFANETFTILKYGEQITLNPGSGSNSSYVFSMNGVYDPNITGTGHQPYGFDEYCAAAGAGPYNRYTVARSRIHLVAFCPQIQNATPGTVETRGGVIISVNARRENQTNFTTAYNNLEDPTLLTWALVNQFQSCKRLSSRWISIGRYFGLDQRVYDSDMDWSGTYAANPAFQGYYIISASTPAQGITDPLDIYLTVVEEFEVKFWSQNASVASVSERIHQLEAKILLLTEKENPTRPISPPPPEASVRGIERLLYYE